MRKIVYFILVIMLTSCTTQQAKDILEKLFFENDEYVDETPTMDDNETEYVDCYEVDEQENYQYEQPQDDKDTKIAELEAEIARLEQQNEELNTIYNQTNLESNGTLDKGEFTVAQGGKVYFSQGNLQYQASTGTWRFAEHQWDMIGKDNENISQNYEGWIDLFGWGTSGYKSKYPYMILQEETYYGDGENDIAETKYDWGVYNKISNGGNKTGMWRTLTNAEWDYILNGRPRCENLYSISRVNGINGLILLPDKWSLATEFVPKAEKYETNDYTLEEWETMEANGAVFLPASGRFGMDVEKAGSHGYYWSSSAFDDYAADYLHLYGGDVSLVSGGSRNYGRSVRLVQNVK